MANKWTSKAVRADSFLFIPFQTDNTSKRRIRDNIIGERNARLLSLRFGKIVDLLVLRTGREYNLAKTTCGKRYSVIV